VHVLLLLLHLLTAVACRLHRAHHEVRPCRTQGSSPLAH